MKPARVTVYDIAQALGVSHTTVVLALRNHHSVSPQRREQVQRTAERIGYRRDPFLATLAAYRYQTAATKIQSALAWITNSGSGDLRLRFKYVAGLWRGAKQSAERLGYHLDDMPWEPGLTAKRYQQILLARGIRGLLIAPQFHPPPGWQEFDFSRFSIVRCGRSALSPDANVATADALRAMQMAVARMRQYGYRRIGFVVGELDSELDGSAYGGYFAAQHYLRLDPVLPPLITSRVAFAKASDQVGQELKSWLEQQQPDAILTTEPQIPGLIRKLGWRIPEDVAVAGTDTGDLPLDAGLDQSPEIIGRLGAETLVKQLHLSEMGEPPHPVRILVESHWRDGKSLPPKRGGGASRGTRPKASPPRQQIASPVPPQEAVKKHVTVRDIARKLGCAYTTVAMALRGHPAISVRRRNEVRQMAEHMGYRNDSCVSALAAYRKKDGAVTFKSTLAWVNHWEQPEALLEHKEFVGYWQGAIAAAEQLGYQLEDLRWAAGCPARQFQSALLDRGVRGLLIPPHVTAPDWGDFDWSKFSIIRFGLSISVPDSNAVTADQYRAVVMAVTRIHQYGYRRIGLVLSEAFDRRVGGNYYAAFFWAQQKLGLDPRLPPLMTEWEKGGLGKGRKALAQWLDQYKPDAILTTDPEVPAALQKLGCRIPKDIAAAGMSVCDIALDAGIDQCSEAIGRIAVESLVKQINLDERGEPAAPARILVESRWQDGGSLPCLTKPAA